MSKNSVINNVSVLYKKPKFSGNRLKAIRQIIKTDEKLSYCLCRNGLRASMLIKTLTEQSDTKRAVCDRNFARSKYLPCISKVTAPRIYRYVMRFAWGCFLSGGKAAREDHFGRTATCYIKKQVSIF